MARLRSSRWRPRGAAPWWRRRLLARALLLALAGGGSLAPAQSPPRPPRRPAVRVLPPTPIEPEPPAAGAAGGSGEAAGAGEGPAATGTEPDGAVIARLTTSPRLLPEPIAALPETAEIPPPGKVLGHVAGAPGGLDSVAEIHGYLRRLAEASERLRFEVIGRSEEGREIALLAISAPENLAALDRIRQEAAGLADPRRTPRAEAERLAAQGKVVCYLVGGLHAGEASGPAMLAELAFRLAAGDDPELAEIRRRAVVLITPVGDPDGWQRTVDWQRRHLDGTRARGVAWDELREILLPPYLGHYGVAAEDGLELAHAAARAVHETLVRFHPQLVADLAALPGARAGSALLSLAGEGPGGRALARQAADTLQSWDVPGVRVDEQAAERAASSDLLAAALRAGGTRCTLGVFGNGTAGTFERRIGMEKIAWSLRDSVNLGEAAALALLGWAAAHPAELLGGVWESRRAALARATAEPPYGWLLPAAQRDPARLAALAEGLRAQGIELHRLTAGLVSGGRNHPAGTLLVRADQPQRDEMVRLLGGAAPAAAPSLQVAGGLPASVEVSWPLLYGVTVEPSGDPRILAAPMEPATGAPPAAGKVEGEGEIFALCDEGQQSLLPARLALAAYQVDAAEAAFEAGGRTCPPGSWIVQAPRAAVVPVAARFGLDFTALSTLPAVPRHVLVSPRLGLLHLWTDTRGAGWARLALDRDHVPYTLIQLADLRRGRLGGRFDLILMPEAAGGADRLMRGIGTRWQPLPYAATPAAASLGVPDHSDDITGGFGPAELTALRRFVRRGGVLALLGNAGLVAVEGQLAEGVGLAGEVEAEAAGAAQAEAAGAELAVTAARRGEPLAYGYGEHAAVFRAAGPRFEVDPAQRGRVALWFGSRRPAAAGPAADRQPEPAVQAEAAAQAEAAPEPSERAPAGAGAREEKPAEAAAGEPAGAPGRAGDTAMREGVEVEDLEAAAKEKPAPDPTAGDPPPPAPFLLAGSTAAARGLEGRPAIVDLPLGRGHIVLFAFDPFQGGRNRAGLRWVYNLLLNWNHLPG